jgi:peptidoglycan/xylan/chitin deacetylase (PgdA/CDA1 family)
MIQIINAEAAIERYVFNIISMNTGIPFNFDKINNLSNTFSIVYFQNPVKFVGHSVYIYKSKSELGNIGHPYYLIDNNISTINIPIFYSKYRSFKKNVLFSFSNDMPAMWKGYDKKNRPYIVVNFDLIKNIAYHLTRYEEYNNRDTDSYQRFLTSNNTLYHYKIHEYPVVDYLIDLLLNVLNLIKSNKLVKKKIWPSGKKYAVCLTHDVDYVKMKTITRLLYRTYGILRSNYRLVERYQKLKELCKIYSLKEDIFDNFDKWIEIESKYGFHSSFYFISRSIIESLISIDRRYSIKKKHLQDKIKELYRKGWEVGLHGYKNSYKNLSHEKQLLQSVLGSDIIGLRQHYLRIRIPETWRYYEKIGIKYDTSLGFYDNVGFRAGTSYPFKPFDIENNCTIDILVIPLIIMDGSFLYWNCKDHYKTTIDKFIKLKKIVSYYGGVLTLLWHQEYFNDFELPFIKKSYIEILQILKEDNNAFVGSGIEIYNSWMQFLNLKQ